MSVNISKYLAALLLILSIIVLGSTLVNANCYVIYNSCAPTPPNSGCNQTDIAKNNCLNLTSYDTDTGCFPTADPAGGATHECVAGCCCVSAGPNQGMTYHFGETQGVCIATSTATDNHLWFSTIEVPTDSACQAKCNGLIPGGKYNLTGHVTINNAPQNGVIVNLTDANNNQFLTTTDINGFYSYTNMNQTSYSLQSISGTCFYYKPITLDATKQIDIALNCSSVKVYGYIFKNNNVFYPATVNATYNGFTESMTTANGYYEFNDVPSGSPVTITAIDPAATSCTGQNGMTVTSDTTLNVTLSCQKYNVNITVIDDSTPVQIINNAAVTLGTITRNSAADDGVADNIYAFIDLPGGLLTATASKTLPPQGNSILDCSSSIQIDLTDLNPTHSNSIILDKNSCCNTTTTISPTCVNNLRQKTVTYTGTGTCVKNPVITNVSCNQSISIACEWNCSGWTPATCNVSAGDFQRIRTCSGKILANNCDPNLPTPFPSLISSCINSCGDGLLNTSSGEECDYSLNNNIFDATPNCIRDWNATDPQHLISVPYIQSQGFSYVNQICNLGTCKCIPPNTSAVIPLVPACVQNISNIGSISNFSANNVYSQHAFSLSWNKIITCQDYIDHFTLEVCNNDTGQCALSYSMLNDNIPKINTSFYHNGTVGSTYPAISSNTTYCYRLTTIFNSSIAPDKTIVNTVCKRSGDELCLNTHVSSWCGINSGNTIQNCSADNKISNSSCSGNQTCINNNGVASCIDQSECNLCNGILGLFGYQGYTITKKDSKTIICPSLGNPNPNPVNTHLSTNQYSFSCYMDFSRTSVDKSYSCSNVISCYDYTSEDSCNVDYCGKFRQTGANINGCVWKPYSYDGGRNIFGRGICAPVNVSNQQCGLCKETAHNSLGLCTGETCRLFGDCYYTYNYNSYDCVNRADVICDSYKTSFECNKGVDVKTDVSWSAKESDGGIKASGNNAIINRSNDGAGLGVCKWQWYDINDQSDPTNGKCLRDADNMSVGTVDTIPWNDCVIEISGNPSLSNELNTQCEHDVVPPNTSITSISSGTTGAATFGMRVDLHDKVQIQDNNQWSIGDETLCSSSNNECHVITTSYCVAPSGTRCYPNNTLRVTPDGFGTEYTINLSSFSNLAGQLNDGASLTMYYFSEDPARNLELIKSMPFTLDAINPNVTVGMNLNAYQIGMSQWRTNVSFTLTLQPSGSPAKSESSVPVTCSFNITPMTDAAALTFNAGNPGRAIFNIPSNINPNNRLNSNGAILQTMYPGLSEGKYMYQLYCVDSADNPTYATDNFTIIGDSRIYAPYPNGNVNVSTDYLNPSSGNLEIYISVQTNTTGTCRWSDTPLKTNYSDMYQFTTTGGTTHNTIVSMPEIDASGIHKYFIACLLNVNGANGAPQVVYASEGAYPYFIIDDIAPVTDIYYANPAKNYNWSIYDDSVNVSEDLKIRLLCRADNPLFKIGNTNAEFACNNTYYCIEEPGIGKYCTEQFNTNDYKLIGSSDEIIFNYHGINISNKTRYGNNPKIHYYSTDVGGNVADPSETDLRLKNLQLKPPIVQIDGINVTSKGSIIVNSSYLSITVHYVDETEVRVDGTDIRHGNMSVAMDPSGTNGGADYTFTRSYIDNGDYTLLIPGIDNDDNEYNFSASIHVQHSNNSVRLISPPVGIGSVSPYDITVATDYYSNCRYGTSALEACPTKACVYNYASVYTDFDTTGSSSLYHTVKYYGSNATMYIICMTLDTLDETSNDAYVTTSFHVGYDSAKPNINVTFIQNPKTGPDDNKIINSSYSAITVQLLTDIPSVCSINASFPGRALIEINPPQMFKGESLSNYDSYSTVHTYLINYSGRGITNSELFEYTVNCTSRGQWSSTKNVEINFTPFTPAPVMNIALVGESTLTLNQYGVTCTGLCMSPYTSYYSYAKINQTGDCNASTITWVQANYSDLITVKTSTRICVKSYDILGRLSTMQKDINMFDFNNGLLNINYPYSYYYTSGNKTHIYSPNQTFTLDITTLSNLNATVNATCKVFMTKDVLAYNAAHPDNTTPLYKKVFEGMAGGLFDHTSTSTSAVSEHTTAFHITATQNINEPWSIVCNITNIGPGDNSYISRELFFYWDNTAPSVYATVAPSRIFDWSNSNGVTINVTTDDDAMCILNLSKSTITIKNGSSTTTHTLDYTKAFVMLGTNGQDINADQMFNNYGKNRSSYYSLSDIPSEWLALGVDATYNLNINCWNRARLYNSNSTTMYYKLDSSVIINRTSANVFNSSIMPVRLTTNIMSDCIAVIDSGLPVTLSSSDDINHTADIAMTSSGTHIVNITCDVPANSNVAAAHDDYVAMIDTASPVIENLSSTTGQDYTCGLNGFTINVDMSDDTGIAGYNYMIYGPNNVSQLLNVTTTSNHGVISYSGTLQDGGIYTVNVKAKDLVNRFSANRSISITARTPGSSILCDNNIPVLDVNLVSTPFKDMMKATVSCTDDTGCRDIFYYSFTNETSCNNVTYEKTGAYDSTLPAFVSDGILCVMGKDLAGNNGYAEQNITIGIDMSNPLNITIIPHPPTTIYVYPNVLSTKTSPVDITVSTAFPAICKYSMTPNDTENNLSRLYQTYLPFTQSGSTMHQITSINLFDYEQYVDVICYTAQLSTDKAYSRKIIRTVYITDMPTIDSSIIPNYINDWNNRKSILTINTNHESVCTITSNDDQNFPTPYNTGDYADSLTYTNAHKIELNYQNYDLTARSFTYQIICKTLTNDAASSSEDVTYNINNNLTINLISPTLYRNRTLEVYIKTNLISSCTLTWNGVSKGTMQANVSSMQHYMKINTSADGLYTAQFDCSTPTTGLRASANYSIRVDTSIPPLCPNSSLVLCDVYPPVLNISLSETPFMDMIMATVTCTDDTGCKDIYYYSFTNKTTCSNVPYADTGSYGNSWPTFTSNGLLCVKGTDLADNTAYSQANVTIGIDTSNPLNVTIIASPPDTNYIAPNVLITKITPVNLSLTTALTAVCRYSNTPNATETNLSKLFDSYMQFDSSNSTDHLLTNIDMPGYEKYIDVICYSTLLSPSQAFSRKVIRFVYSTDPASIDASVIPNFINDWNNRKSILTINTAPETVCTISSRGTGNNNDIQNFAQPFDTGNYSNALSYTTSHKKELMYDSYDLTARSFSYLIICKTLGNNVSNTLLNVTYNISNNLTINLLSPTTYNNRTIEILIQTNVISYCSMYWNGVSKGSMLANVTNLQHYIKINTSSDGLYTAGFDCSAAVTGLHTMTNFSIRINTSVPAPFCGDSVVQKPSEECDGDNLYGNTCTFGFTGYNYTGGVLQCNAPGTANACKYNFSTCDLGKGWCGDGNIEGPNSQGIYEQCDGTNIPGSLSCASFGFKIGGTLSCNKGCVINTSRCVQQNIGVQGVVGAQTCNNHMLESGEQCESDGNNTINCTNFGYYAGTVNCNSCMYSMTACYFNVNVTPNPSGAYCGNNVRDYNEQCDGTSIMSNSTCKALGNFTGGNVSCSKNCTFNLTKCINNVSSCNNDVKDSGETDLNCGGSCGPCTLNKTCSVNSDCFSGRCSNVTGRCVMNPCNNSIFDSATETDTDCGNTCSPCADDKKCLGDSDCKSGFCIDNICSGDPCSDGLLSPGESDIDCGGSCALCELDSKCNSNTDCSTDYCADGVCTDVPPPSNPIKLSLLIIGIVLILGGGGYIIYKTFIVKQSPGRGFDQGMMTPFSTGPNGTSPDMTPKPIKLSPEMLARQREAMIKKRQVRAEERKGMIGKLDDTSSSGDAKNIVKGNDKSDDKSKKIDATTDKSDKNKGEKTDEFVELSTIKGSKDKDVDSKATKDKKDTFSKLKEIGKGQSKAFEKLKEIKSLKTDDVAKKIAQISGASTDNIKPKLSSTESFTDKDAMKLFGEMDRTTLMSGVFTDVLSQLLTSKKITKENVSKILFEYMDKGLLNKGDVAKISSDLKLI